MTTVLKIGGALLRDEQDLEQLADHVARVHRAGEPLVLVHGGGDEIGELHSALGVPYEKRMGLRATSEDGMPLVTMVLCGLVNKRLVAELVKRGVKAVGLSGVDFGMMRSDFLNRTMLGRVGGFPRVDGAPLRRLLDDGALPVVAPVSLGSDGAPINVNADTAAHAISVAIDADRLEFAVDVPGIVTGSQVAARLTAEEGLALIDDSVIHGGMVPKLQAALAALDAGVGRVRVGDLAGLQANTATVVLAEAA